MRHGSTTAYTGGCRCDECRAGWRDYCRDYRARRASARKAAGESFELDPARDELRDLLLELFPLGLTNDCPARRGLGVT
jgi:hypothetical protein